MASRLLIVDDDPMMTQALSAMVELRLNGVAIDTCESATAALKHIGDTDYDAIVSDVKMPGMDGFQLMERVLKIRPTTPTLLVTGHGDHDMGVKALNAGAYAFIPKPIDRDFFIAWLKRAIQLRQLSRRVEQHTQELEETVQERTGELHRNNLQLRTVAELNRKSEALSRSLADAMPQIVYTAHADGATDYVNEQWVRYTGVSKDQALKLYWMEALHPDDVAVARARWSEAVRDGTICETEYRLRRADGEYRWHLSRAVPQRDEQGRIARWIGTSTDIHDGKRMEQSLRESEDRYKRLVKYSPDAILINRDNRIVFVNEAGLALFGATHRDQLLGKSPFDLFHLECHPLVAQRITRLEKDGEALAMAEARILRLDGAVVDVEVLASTFLDQGTRAIHVILRDITVRKQAEDAMRQRTAQFETLLNQAPLGVYVVDGDFRIRQVNPIALAVFGAIPDLIGRDFDEVIHILWPQGYADEIVAIFRHTLETGEPYLAPERIEERRDRGLTEYYEWRIDRIPLSEGRYGVVCYFRDISTRVQAREAMAESEERFRTLADHMSQFAWMADPTGWIFWYNRRWFEYTGTTLDEMQGWGWEKVHHPDHLDRVIQKWRRAHETGEPWEDTFPLRGTDGNYRWFLSRAMPIRDAEGKVTRWFGTNTDVTNQLAAEASLRDKQEQLVQAAKLASIGELASGVAHELNNPLNNIGLFIGNVLHSVEEGQIDPQRMRYNLQTALQQVDKAAAIISHLRTFARAAVTQPEPVSLNGVIHSAVSLVEAQLRLHNVRLALHLDPNNPVVLGNAIQLEQVFINLLTNAQDAVERTTDKRITIESTNGGSHVDITVTDTGAGIAPEYHARIFDPFFTTKEIGKGTGLGLSISYGIIKDHQGTITVDSEFNKGTTFTIALPTLQESPAF